MTDFENGRAGAPSERAARTARAVAAATAIAAAHGVRASEPVALAEGYAVRVHLRPAPVVARVSTLTALLRRPVDAWLARELDVAAFLAARGAPVVPPSDLLPPGPHARDGLCVTFWRYVGPASGEVPGQALAGRMLADLHAELRHYAGDLPLLAPPLNDIPRALERLGGPDAALGKGDVALIRRAYETMLLRLKPGAVGPLQPVHGDAHVYNLIASDGDWLWNDFEDACLGPVAWDLAGLDVDGEAIAAYRGAPDAESLGLFREVRRLHAVAWAYALAPEFPDALPHVAPLLEQIRRGELARRGERGAGAAARVPADLPSRPGPGRSAGAGRRWSCETSSSPSCSPAASAGPSRPSARRRRRRPGAGRTGASARRRLAGRRRSRPARRERDGVGRRPLRLQWRRGKKTNDAPFRPHLGPPAVGAAGPRPPARAALRRGRGGRRAATRAALPRQPRRGAGPLPRLAEAARGRARRPGRDAALRPGPRRGRAGLRRAARRRVAHRAPGRPPRRQPLGPLARRARRGALAHGRGSTTRGRGRCSRACSTKRTACGAAGPTTTCASRWGGSPSVTFRPATPRARFR